MTSLSFSQSTILAAITQAAAKRIACPKNIDLAEMAGLRAESSAQSVVKRLQDLGYLRIEASANWRVAVMANGTRTATQEEAGRQLIAPSLRIVSRAIGEKAPVPTTPPVFRDPCPGCNTRLDADPALCCPRGRAIRKLVA